MATFYEDKTERPGVLKSKYQIGSKAAPINYRSNQTVFHINETPVEKQAAKQWVQNSLKSKILTTSKPSWNNATSTGEPLCTRPTYVNSKLTRSNMFVYNYRAEKLPTSYPLLKPKSNKFNHGILEVQLKDYDQGDETFSDDRIKRGIGRLMEELPIHPNLKDKTPWNISSDIKAPIHREKFMDTERARYKNSQKKAQKVKGYISPEQAYKARLQAERERKIKEYEKEHASYDDVLPSAGLYDKLEAEARSRKSEN